ncbi:hypothetical protein [Streptacidiphilus melanogenes]|uniref:hypothetical protein n=1 Tax=Streptacidiphilus melanogenes TaxID=411235 RepID=UPI0012698AC8|nr:hypothetical protein [Streptacidiphilus melanogenes]
MSGSRLSTGGPLLRGYSTPECRTGAERWPDLHQMCSAPGYQGRVLGWVTVPCVCSCHEQRAAEERAS